MKQIAAMAERNNSIISNHQPSSDLSSISRHKSLSNENTADSCSTSASIQRILEQNLPPTLLDVLQYDTSFREYLLQVLYNYALDDDNQDEGMESVQETISTLLMGHLMDDNEILLDEAELNNIVRTILMSIQRQISRTKTNKKGTANDDVQVKLLEAPGIKGITTGVNTIDQQDQSQQERDSVAAPSTKGSEPTPFTKGGRLAQRKQERREKQLQKAQKDGHKMKASNSTNRQPEATDTDDNKNSSTSLSWGGRGKGGRGIRTIHNSSKSSNIHLTHVSLLMDNGNELLQDSIMDIQKAHVYGLIGRNGVGKSTLLRRLATGDIPGLPNDFCVLFVEQQVSGNDTQTTLQSLINADIVRTELLQEQNEIEHQMDDDTITDQNDGTNLTQIAQRLNEITIELDAINADTIEDRALEILKGLQFTKTMIQQRTSDLSGGWRMRLAIAQALIQIHTCDLLLLDECTNHLDLHGLDWLIRYLTNTRQSDHALIVVSHDRAFLDAVCTDIIVMEPKKLHYHVGTYSDYERQKQEKTARQTQILDAAERQRTKAVAFVQKHQQASSSSADPNKQRQAKMIKEKKIDRIGNYREDGKRYKNYSLQKLDESYIRVAQKVHIEVDDAIAPMYFPDPAWPPSIANATTPILRMENVCFAYNKQEEQLETNNDGTDALLFPSKKLSSSSYLLNNITINLSRESKIALVGKNGTGKSTLCKLVSDMLSSPNVQAEYKQCGDVLQGELWSHPNLRVGHVTQYSVEELEQKYGDKSVLEYAELIGLNTAKASASIISKAAGNIRQYLGAFGLGDSKYVSSPIRLLSGGERMRLCFASVLANEPHLLLLDESTNHVDIETQEVMSDALKKFHGAVLMVSHNQAFLSGFCKDLWVLDSKGYLTVNHSDTESFDEIFSHYRCHILNQHLTLASRRQEKAQLAKKAKSQKPSSYQGTGLL